MTCTKRAIDLVLPEQEEDARRVQEDSRALYPLDRHFQQEVYELILNSDKEYIIINAPKGTR